MNSRGQFIIEGIKQAIRTYLILLAIGSIAGLTAWLLSTYCNEKNVIIGLLTMIGVATAFVLGCLVVGPVPFLLIHSDISNWQLLFFSCLLAVFYWAALGMICGLSGWITFQVASKDNTKEFPRACFVKELRSRVDLTAVLATLACVCLFSIHASGQGDTRHIRVIMKLREIEAAKKMFAADHVVSTDYTPTVADLAEYLPLKNGVLPRIGPESYVVNSMTNPPYAVLTNDWWVPRHGWQVGHLVGTNGQIFRLPPAK